jgi:hypothetical protein
MFSADGVEGFLYSPGVRTYIRTDYSLCVLCTMYYVLYMYNAYVL